MVKVSVNHDTKTTDWVTNHIKATQTGLIPPLQVCPPTRGPAKRQGSTVILTDMINGREKERGVVGGCLVLLMVLEMRLKGKLQTDWIVFAIIAENSLCRQATNNRLIKTRDCKRRGRERESEANWELSFQQSHIQKCEINQVWDKFTA